MISQLPTLWEYTAQALRREFERIGAAEPDVFLVTLYYTLPPGEDPRTATLEVQFNSERHWAEHVSRRPGSRRARAGTTSGSPARPCCGTPTLS